MNYVPKCRTCGKPLVVKEAPAGFTDKMFGFEGEMQPCTGRVSACPEHPSAAPVWVAEPPVKARTVFESGPAAAVAFIEREDGKILVVWNKRYGRWALPGGKVEKDETPLMACLRELREETGIHAGLGGVTMPVPLYEGPHGESVESDRGSYVYVFRVVIGPCLGLGKCPYANIYGCLEHRSPQEIEEGCPVTWHSREEFLKWGLAPEFYKRMFVRLDAEQDAREGKLYPSTWSCACGVQVSPVEMRVQENSPPAVVQCNGCGKALYIRGPHACSHDGDGCELFHTKCSHQLFEMHKTALNKPREPRECGGCC